MRWQMPYFPLIGLGWMWLNRDTNEPTRRKTRSIRNYDRYRFDNESGREINDRLPDRRPEPSTYNEAITCEDHRLWKIVIGKQLNSLIANGTWKLVNRPFSDVNVITFK